MASVLSPQQEFLVREYQDLARSIANRVFWKTPPGYWELGEMEGIALEALVQSATIWPRYCEERGFSPHRPDYFKAYALRRVAGAIHDAMRKQSILTRSQLDIVTALRRERSKGRTSDAEVAISLGWTEEILDKARKADQIRVVPLDVVEDQPEEISEGLPWVTSVVDEIRKLPQETQVILALHFYVGDNRTQISEKLGWPMAKVSALLNQGIQVVYREIRNGLEV